MTRGRGFALAVVALLASLTSLPPLQAASTSWYDGRCTSNDSNGVTVVVDFQQLDANDGRAAPTIERCSPVKDNDATVKRTGLQALADAGLTASGTSRWGDTFPTNVPFICRIQGRPAADEPLRLTSSGTTYYEPCGDTPPADAYWSYWYTDGSSSVWRYATQGAMARIVTPGGYEGWSFSLNVPADQRASPRVTPVVNDTPTATPTPSATPSPTTGPTTDDDSDTAAPTSAPTSDRARQSAGWLASELQPAGQMPGSTGDTDWGLTADTLLALAAAGTGTSAIRQITDQLAANAGSYIGPDVFKSPDARIGGSVAKLLVIAEVAGRDPDAFGSSAYLPAGKTYDLRAETLALLEKSGAQTGRISNRGTGNDQTNIFAQSLAVIGLARSGGVPASATDFLQSQQCSAGFFRMFFADKLSCDAGEGQPDNDGTSIALQALMTARANGVDGLDEPITRGLSWLLAQQLPNGSYGGGTGTSVANSNSTGLAAQTLAAGAATAKGTRAQALKAGVAKARDWVLGLHADAATAKGTKLEADNEYGAIAYNRSAFTAAKAAGIDTPSRDQWRRATTQAIFALAPVSLADLTTVDVSGDPVDQNHPKDTTKDTSGGDPAPPPGTTSTVPVTPGSTPAAVTATASARLAAYLSSQLVDGDHIEVTDRGTTYVDYDATADVVFALTALGSTDAAAKDALTRTRTFLLHPKSIAAYASGVPYEKGPAAYAEPIAKLALIARLSRTADPSKAAVDKVASLDARLDALSGLDGTYTDLGTYADSTDNTVRQAWITLARAAAGADTSAEAAQLLTAQCTDGGFAATLASCSKGDPAVTAEAVLALNASAAQRGSAAQLLAFAPGLTVDFDAANAVPTSWKADRAEAIEKAAAAALASSARDGLLRDDTANLVGAATVAVTRQAAGLDIANTVNSLAMQQRADGGFVATVPTGAAAKAATSTLAASLAVAPAVAGRSWTSASTAPVSATIRLPLAATPDTVRSTTVSSRTVPWWRTAGLMGASAFGGALVAVAVMARRRSRNPRKGQ